jgi:hypothetical protein
MVALEMDIGEAEPAKLVAVMQRPGKRMWAIYAKALLRDPARRNRDPDIYLAERAAAGDKRVVQLAAGEKIWAPVDGEWAPVLEPPFPRVRWSRGADDVWQWAVRS